MTLVWSSESSAALGGASAASRGFAGIIHRDHSSIRPGRRLWGLFSS